MPHLPFPAFLVGVAAATYGTLVMADTAGQRSDTFTFPRRPQDSYSSKDYEKVGLGLYFILSLLGSISMSYVCLRVLPACA